MVVLSNQDRLRVASGFMREQTGGPFGLTKAQLAAAVSDTDDWVEANTASFNTALPAAFRTSTSTW